MTNSAIEPLAVHINVACQILGVGKTTVYGLAKEGKLKLVKIKGRTLAPMTELRRLAEGAA